MSFGVILSFWIQTDRNDKNRKQNLKVCKFELVRFSNSVVT